MYIKIKRILDVIISSVILVLLLPLFIIISVFIKLDSKGEIFFKQDRLSKDGKVFCMYKFRSMVKNAENMGAGLFNYKNDSRVTKVGRFLRNSSLDELPQLINVIKGDMAIVGPRPCVSYELGDYSTLNKRYKKRFEVLPGITGLAQISGRNELPWDEKVNYDNLYIELLKQKGILIDIKIIFKTVFKLFNKQSIYEHKPENLDDDLAASETEAMIIENAHRQEIKK